MTDWPEPRPDARTLLLDEVELGEPIRLRTGGRVLLAVAGAGDDWSTLRDHLGTAECRDVDLVEVSHLDQAGGVETLMPPLDGVEAAIVVLGRSADPHGPDDQRLAQITHLIGLLHGLLGAGRVLVLVESSLAGLLAGTGVIEAPYREGRIGDEFPRVRALLSEAEALEPPPSGLLSRFGVTHASLAPELWLVLGPLLVLGAVLAVIGLGLLSWRSAGGPATQQITIDPAALAGVAPAGGGVPLGAGPGVDTLPARCVVNTGPTASLPEVIACEGVGQLMASGYLGPWHNEMSSISLDSGVLGEATLGVRVGQTAPGQVALQPGTDQSLAAYRAGGGVERIELTFAAYGQQVIIHQDRSRGGRQVTFTFTGG